MPEGTSPTGQTPDGRKVTVGLENAATAWPTPMAGTPAQNGNSAAGNSDFSRKAEELAQAVMWKTPRVTSGEYTRDRGRKGAERPTLEGEAAMWGTPRASDAEKGGPNMAFGAGGTPLPAQAAQWPTPAARDTRSESASEQYQASRWEHKRGKPLTEVVRVFSHTAPETPQRGPKLSQLRPIWRPLRDWLIASHGRPTWRRLWKARTKRRLNPLFVEWLMGWPPGHALCDCSATEWSRYRQHMRGALSQLPTASGAWIWAPPKEAPTPVQIEMFGG